MLLIHEVVHAFDMQLYPELARRIDAPLSANESRAAAFVLEGHAQWVAQRVAARLGLQDAFDELDELLTASDQYPDMQYAYENGPPWIQARFEAGGLAAVQAALARPPDDRP